MLRMKKILAALLALCICLGVFAGCGGNTQAPSAQAAASQTETAETSHQLGGKLEDFSFTTYDGQTMTLYEVLQEKDMVLLNFWATWCGPCAFEFPYMEEAYRQFGDRVEIFAMSVEPTDSDEVLSDYVAQRELTFPVGRDTSGLGSVFAYSGIPTSVLIDRYGTICLIETGAQTSADTFTNVFELYTSEDYSESIIIQSMRTAKATAEPATEAELSSALNAEGEKLAFTNSKNPFIWPMQVTELDGRKVVTPSNIAVSSSEARVSAAVEAKAGDVVEITFKMACEDTDNYMKILVDGKTVKTFSSNRDWITYAHAFETTGSHTVVVSFVKGGYTDDGGDTFWLDSIRLLSGEAGEASLKKNPFYPVAGESKIEVVTPDLQKLVFYETATQAVAAEGYICPEGYADLLVKLEKTVDPERAYLMDSSYVPRKLSDGAQSDGYHITWQVTKDQIFHDVMLFTGDTAIQGVYLFADEASVLNFADYLNPGFDWKYVEEAMQLPTVSAAEAAYTVRYVDQDGNPVAGVMCQVCDDSICQVFTSDENGLCQFSLAPYAYEVHTLKLPDGYEGDTETILYAPENGGEMTITLNRK